MPFTAAEEGLQRLEEHADAEAEEHLARRRSTAFAGLDDLGAGLAFGIAQLAVLLDDQVAPQRHHHQDAEQAPGDRDQRREPDLQRIPEEDQRRHREHHRRSDRFACRAGGLHDVVLEYGALTVLAPDGPGRQHRDRHRCRGREPDAQRKVRRRRAEDDPEDRAEQERAERELRRVLLGRDVRPEALARLAHAGLPASDFFIATPTSTAAHHRVEDQREVVVIHGEAALEVLADLLAHGQEVAIIPGGILSEWDGLEDRAEDARERASGDETRREEHASGDLALFLLAAQLVAERAAAFHPRRSGRWC